MASIPATTGNRKLDKHDALLPAIIAGGGATAEFAYREFFDAEIENDHTRKAYRTAVLRFLDACESERLSLQNVTPWFVSQHIRELTNLRNGKPSSVRTRKLHLAGIRQFFDVLVVRHAVVLNPALSVKGPRFSESEGTTPAISPADVQRVFEAIDVGTDLDPDMIGLRDTAILGVLAYTGARSGAVAKLRIRDYYNDGTQWLLHFREKNGKIRHIPVRHDLQQSIDAYVAANGYLIFNGRAVRFRYRQTGAVGQGRILFETEWLDELKRAMEGDFPKQRKISRQSLPNIHVELGVPQG